MNQHFVIISLFPILAACLHGQTLITPKMGGGVEASAPMIHIDLYYDYEANQMQARLDTSYGVPWLRALPEGYAFDTNSSHGILHGKAYNYQYGWNLGGLFTPPAGAAIWIESLSGTPGLECYDGRGSMGDYAPIFGTGDSSPIWPWSGVMVHNTYAVSNSYRSTLTADYRIFFGDATTGSPTGFESYKQAHVHLEWKTCPILHPEALQIGTVKTNPIEKLHFLNAYQFSPESGRVVSLNQPEKALWPEAYSGPFIITVLPSTPALGGPKTNSPATGSRIELQVLSIQGPTGGKFGVWDAGEDQPIFLNPSGPVSRFLVSESNGEAEADPFGQRLDRRFIVTKPGLYTITFQAIDTSQQGLNGQALHESSEVITLRFRAGLMIESIRNRDGQREITFHGLTSNTYSLETSFTLGPSTVWSVVDGPLRGTNSTMTLVDIHPQTPSQLYRIKME